MVKIDALDGPAAGAESGATPPPPAETPAAAPPVVASATPAPPQFATLTQPVRIKIPYGETVLPRGLKLTIVRREGQTVTVQYLGQTQVIPIASTDLR